MYTAIRMYLMSTKKKVEYIEKNATRIGQRKIKNLQKVLYIKDGLLFELIYRGKVLLQIQKFKNLAEFEHNFANEFRKRYF